MKLGSEILKFLDYLGKGLFMLSVVVILAGLFLLGFLAIASVFSEAVMLGVLAVLSLIAVAVFLGWASSDDDL